MTAPDRLAIRHRALVDRLRRFIGSEAVIDAMAAVPRHLFVPDEYEEAAYEDSSLPIAEGQTISQPSLVARMCELLELTGGDDVLDIGTGSGYHAAVLSRLAGRIVSIERHATLAALARRNLDAAGIDNVNVVIGDGSRGYEEAAPYDAINVAAAIRGRRPPAALEAQLAPGGRLVAPVGEDGQRLMVARRTDSQLESEPLEPVRFVPLVEAHDDRA